MTKTSFVYFQRHKDHDWVRVGTTNAKGGTRENQQTDYEMIAMIPGTDSEENAIHDYFTDQRIPDRGSSTYGGLAIFEYVAWLLERRFAARSRVDAARLPRLPFHVWSPEQLRLDEARSGQRTLLASIDPRERVAYSHDSLIYLSSETDEWYTPPDIIEMARKAMGSIDTDPASCLEAQAYIQAPIYYTKYYDGLRSDLPWSGNVWLNPPYGKGDSRAELFIERLVAELDAGTVTQAVTCLSVNSITAHWFDALWRVAAGHLIWRGRPNFYNPESGSNSPTKGTVLSYFGQNLGRFSDVFGSHGHIVTTGTR